MSFPQRRKSRTRVAACGSDTIFILLRPLRDCVILSVSSSRPPAPTAKRPCYPLSLMSWSSDTLVTCSPPFVTATTMAFRIHYTHHIVCTSPPKMPRIFEYFQTFHIIFRIFSNVSHHFSNIFKRFRTFLSYLFCLIVTNQPSHPRFPPKN